jgi:hypothetical protein
MNSEPQRRASLVTSDHCHRLFPSRPRGGRRRHRKDLARAGQDFRLRGTFRELCLPNVARAGIEGDRGRDSPYPSAGFRPHEVSSREPSARPDLGHPGRTRAATWGRRHLQHGHAACLASSLQALGGEGRGDDRKVPKRAGPLLSRCGQNLRSKLFSCAEDIAAVGIGAHPRHGVSDQLASACRIGHADWIACDSRIRRAASP